MSKNSVSAAALGLAIALSAQATPVDALSAASLRPVDALERAGHDGAVRRGLMLDRGAALSSFESAVVKARPAPLQPALSSWSELAAGGGAFETLRADSDPGAAGIGSGSVADPHRFPEPTSLALVGAGLVGIAAARYRRRRLGA